MSGKTRKANGHGHTYKLGNSWRTVIRRGDKVFTASSPNRTESRKRAKEKLNDNLRSKTSELPKNSSLASKEYLINWLNTEHKNNLAASTFRRYESLMRIHIIPFIGNIPLSDLTKKDLSDLLAFMANEGQSQRSQQQARAVIKLALRHAYESDLITNNPALSLRSIRVESKQISPLTIDEVKVLLKRNGSSCLGARLHIALICGLRQGEALGLRWSDIDLKKKTLNVQQQLQRINGEYQLVPLKTFRSRRTIVLTDDSTRVLSAYRQSVHQNDLVFTEPDGSPRSAHGDYSDWQRALKESGIKPRRLHDARHTSATLMYSQGIGIETISRALGHSSSAITSRLYVHSNEEPLRRAAEKMSSLIDISKQELT